MLARLALLASVASGVLAQQVIQASSYTGWDCCKPTCANINNNQALLNSRGPVKVCDRNNNALGQNEGMTVTTGCQSNGAGFMCDDFQPVPVASDLSYGFAIKVGGSRTGDHPDCCKCYEITWRNGPAAGKRMVVQNVVPGIVSGSVRANDMIILVPGGGIGPESSGCSRQYGSVSRWGDQYGGLESRQGCENLPANLQAGCYWRFNWAGGQVNNWSIQYRQVTCPSRLTDISGCSA